ncbi:hypothetical protein DFP73DRAFT_108840 [Morchella snyderi]|nr:hypothetical protein DFP73DRAFT_108840 [Morchella snyderi]
MAEIIGLAASIITLIELTGKVIALGSRYISAVKDAEQQMKMLCLELSALSDVLKSLGDLANKSNKLDVLRVPIQQCTEQMKELELQLRPMKRRLMNRWKWPFDGEHTSKILESIERNKSLFSIALEAEQFHIILAVEVYTRNADRKLDEVKRFLAEKLSVSTQQRDLEEERNRGMGNPFPLVLYTIAL